MFKVHTKKSEQTTWVAKFKELKKMPRYESRNKMPVETRDRIAIQRGAFRLDCLMKVP